MAAGRWMSAAATSGCRNPRAGSAGASFAARRLAGALETQDHDDRRRPGRHRQPVRRAAEQLDQLAVDDLHHLLRPASAM